MRDLIVPASVTGQRFEALRLEALSRLRVLNPAETDLLEELIRLDRLRERVRRHRIAEQRARAAARLSQLSAA